MFIFSSSGFSVGSITNFIEYQNLGGGDWLHVAKQTIVNLLRHRDSPLSTANETL